MSKRMGMYLNLFTDGKIKAEEVVRKVVAMIDDHVEDLENQGWEPQFSVHSAGYGKRVLTVEEEDEADESA